MVNWKLEAEPAQKSFDLQLMPMPLSCLSLSRELFQLRIMQCSDQNNKLLTLNESNSSSCHCLSLGREFLQQHVCQLHVVIAILSGFVQ